MCLRYGTNSLRGNGSLMVINEVYITVACCKEKSVPSALLLCAQKHTNTERKTVGCKSGAFNQYGSGNVKRNGTYFVSGANLGLVASSLRTTLLKTHN